MLAYRSKFRRTIIYRQTTHIYMKIYRKKSEIFKLFKTTLDPVLFCFKHNHHPSKIIDQPKFYISRRSNYQTNHSANLSHQNYIESI